MNVSSSQIRGMVLAGLMMTPGAVQIGGTEAADWAELRQKMLEDIAVHVARYSNTLGCSTLSPPVIQAMADTPRHLFVPKAYRVYAYDNNPLPIGQGQTISQPTIVAVMTELMAVDLADTVLEVGTGSGYQAAVLSELVAHVHTIEIVPELARSAAHTLRGLQYDNITVHEGDGYAGVPAHAPYDAIMVTAAPDALPPALLDQLKPGGVLVAPVGHQGEAQWLTVWHKKEDGSFEQKIIMPVRFVPMVSRADH